MTNRKRVTSNQNIKETSNKKTKIRISLSDFKLKDNNCNASECKNVDSDTASLVSENESIRSKLEEKVDIDVGDSINENKPSTDLLELDKLTINSAIRLAFEGEYAETLPKGVKTDALFCIDLNRFPLADVKADDNGGFRENGNKHKYYEIRDNNNTFLSSKYNPRYKTNQYVYHLYIIYGTSLSNPFFKRKMIRIENCKQPTSFDVLTLCYFWQSNAPNHNFDLKVHGNSTKNNNPYLRTSLTTKTTCRKTRKY